MKNLNSLEVQRFTIEDEEGSLRSVVRGIEARLQDLQDHSGSDGYRLKQKTGRRAYISRDSTRKPGKESTN